MKAEIETLEALHNEVAEAMLAKLRSGTAVAADFAAIRGFLKDNYIAIAMGKTESPLADLIDDIDAYEEDETVVSFARSD